MTPRRRLLHMAAMGLLMAAALTRPALSEDLWYAHYVRALALIQAGEAQEARSELEQAVALRAEPGLRLKTDGVNYVDYLPNLYFAIASHMSGDAAAAREHFLLADAAGVAALSEAGSALLESYRMLLGVAPEEEASGEVADTPVDRHNHAVRDAADTVLSQTDFQKLGRTVMGRCGLDPETQFAEAPWYFHYELGMELVRRGDPQRALSALVQATDRRPEPRYATRVYGMWFLDYLPYFEIAKLQAELGNWSCASDALKVSEQRHELSATDPRITEVEALKEELANRLFF